MTEEGEIQKSVFAHLRERGVPGIVFWHCPNSKEARRKSGYRAGVSDVHILNRGEFFSLELKRQKGFKIDQEQIDFQHEVNRARGHAYIAKGLDDALAWLEVQGIIRRAS